MSMIVPWAEPVALIPPSARPATDLICCNGYLKNL